YFGRNTIINELSQNAVKNYIAKGSQAKNIKQNGLIMIDVFLKSAFKTVFSLLETLFFFKVC
ncbi:hypothetical protein ACR79R_21285, partial [Sphingobacterium spiritivorum]|uniref:hypothetical protein n=1 Tax=Sphingobacterium spiritivorum TaxID=258 RepID=UPI003DA3497C